MKVREVTAKISNKTIFLNHWYLSIEPTFLQCKYINNIINIKRLTTSQTGDK